MIPADLIATAPKAVAAAAEDYNARLADYHTSVSEVARAKAATERAKLERRKQVADAVERGAGLPETNVIAARPTIRPVRRAAEAGR